MHLILVPHKNRGPADYESWGYIFKKNLKIELKFIITMPYK